MRLLLAVFVCAFLLTGAKCIDTATGVTKNPDGTVTVNPNSPVAVAGGVVGSLPIPFAGIIGGIFTGIPGIWAALRGRKYKVALTSTAHVIEDFGKSTEGQAIIGKLKEKLAAAHTVADVQAILKPIIEKVNG